MVIAIVLLLWMLVAIAGILLIAVPLCRAAADGDDVYERARFAPAPADLDVIVGALDDMGDEAGAVVIAFPLDRRDGGGMAA